MIETTYRTARRIVVAIIGGTVVLVGVAMIALPGPAVVVIPMGLAILGIEFAFARRWLRTLRERSKALYDELVRDGESNQSSISSVSTSKGAQ
jgi:tellurite resistance protein TerC